MRKTICQNCSKEILNEFGVTLSYCTDCGASVNLAPNEQKTESFKTVAPPKARSQFLTILATSFFTALFFIVILAGVVYWFVNRTPENTTISSPTNTLTGSIKPTPRPKKNSAISASEITKIQFSESLQKTQPAPVQYFGNVNPNNYFSTSNVVNFTADGAATKISTRISTINGVRNLEQTEQFKASIAPEKFLQMAQVFVENDFLGEEDSKTSTSLPIKNALTVSYSSGEKNFQTSNSGRDTPEAEAMLKAFKELENSANWRKQ